MTQHTDWRARLKSIMTDRVAAAFTGGGEVRAIHSTREQRHALDMLAGLAGVRDVVRTFDGQGVVVTGPGDEPICIPKKMWTELVAAGFILNGTAEITADGRAVLAGGSDIVMFCGADVTAGMPAAA